MKQQKAEKQVLTQEQIKGCNMVSACKIGSKKSFVSVK